MALPGAIGRACLGLAVRLRELVEPELGAVSGRAHHEVGKGGDITFAIDEMAEAMIEPWLAENAPGLAFYSEDRGLVEPSGDAEWVLVVDPIDGTRPAMAGLESACVSVAAAPLGSEPTMGDVEVGVIVEILTGRRFVCVRGEPPEPEPRLSANVEIERMMWTYGLRGRPAVAMARVLEELIDRSSVAGASFDLGSATFDMTRIVTGQLDAYIEPGPRMVEEVAGMREEFERVGRGQILNNSPYDLAAAVLCLESSGAVVTDAAGRSLSDRPLLGSGAEYQMSCVAASNRALHEQILELLDRGLDRLGRAGDER